MSTAETATRPPRTPHRIETDRIVLRCYEPGDADALRVVCAENREHLLPWLPWAEADPQTLDEKLELVLTFRANYDRDESCVMGIFDAASGELVGGSGYNPSPGKSYSKIREIGYWIAKSQEGKGYVTEAVQGLLVVGFRKLGLDSLIIRCEPENSRSASIPERLGFVNEGLQRCAVPRDDGYAPAHCYTMLAAEHSASDACRDWVNDPARVRCFDAMGRRW